VLTVQPWTYHCERCGHRESIDTPAWRCPACAGAFALAGPNQVDRATILPDEPTLWRYDALLPVTRENARSLGEGMTPLVAGTLAGRPVWFKCDHLLPTGSFKDRGAVVLVAHLRRLGRTRVIVDSSGNAAAAMAGYAAANGIACTVYAPATTSAGKLVQARAFGATVHLVAGNREDVARAAQEAAAVDPTAFYASHNWHAVFVEGVKTWALEVWEQLGQRNPDAAFVPAGGGSAYVGAHRGFAATGTALPALIAAQPAACAPIAAACAAGANEIAPVTPGPTIAEGTRIGMPARGRQILDAIAASGGWAEAVTEDQIVAALRELWAQGLYVEPTAAVGAAACRAVLARGAVPDDEIVVLLTGSGLKSTETIGELLAGQPA
jgi:threonine synthase